MPIIMGMEGTMPYFKPTTTLLVMAAIALVGCGRSYQTIRTYESTAKTSPASYQPGEASAPSDSLQTAGERQFRAGKLEAASQSFYKAIVASPENWKARWFLGRIATTRKEYAVAESWFEQALTFIDHSAPQRSAIYVSRAQMHEHAGQPAQALLDYRTAVNLDPENRDAAEGQTRLSAALGVASMPR
jgi:tetratricopeptide (TPR) repeat protein